ncbi:tetratricopeptide repeat protein [Fodinibius sp.]|uniref:protein kinase domain-containing protein n=1 Tax=Fodinibius sp. TaxID=1872440 RepID=UPI003566A372
MGEENWEKIETIIDRVLELPKSQRDIFINEQCKGDKELKSEVTMLLESIFDSEGWLDDPKEYKEEFYNDISDDIKELSSEHALIGRQVGSYTIKEQIGQGGMGAVFLAQRSDDSFDHRVAIKIIRQERATQSNIHRFEQEQRILAQLNHPGIAQLYDGGITVDGFPYIIMEYVDGTPMDEYCRLNACSIDEVIHVFMQVLEAVRYAHENLVIHRDLKPDNILINDSGSIKILDFGISKLLEEEEKSPTRRTQEARLLTPRYAAPEQIRQDPVKTSTDVYALGVVLYELLAGTGPFTFNDSSHYAIEQTILKKEPPKPSSKAADGAIQKKLEGDLDAIVLKAIRKDPDDRYRGITEFLDDLYNYQHDLPVRAQKGTATYRLSKFFKRNKKGLAITAGIVLLLMSLTSFYTWRIAQERDHAQLQADRAEEITNFLVSILQLNNPSENVGEDITVSEAMLRGIDYVEEQEMSAFNRATILGTIGSIQINTGDIEEAGLSLEKGMAFVMDSLSEQSEKTLAIGTKYAEWHEDVGNTREAERYYHLTDSLFRTHQLTNSLKFYAHQLNYSDFLLETGQYEKALQVLSQSEQDLNNTAGKDRSLIDLQADMYNNRGRAYKNMGENQKALDNLDKALNLKQEIYGENNPKIGRLYHNMGVVYGTIRDFKQAKKMAEQAYEIRVQTLGPEHQLVGSTLHLLGNIAFELENYEQAFEYNRKSIEINKQKHGPQHFRYALALREYAKTLSATGRFEKAQQQIDQAIAIIGNNYGENHPYYGYMTNTYASIYEQVEDYSQAMEYGQQTISIFEKNLGAQHPNLGEVFCTQGKYALKRNKYQQADSLLTAGLEILELHFDRDNPLITEADSLLKVTKANLP